MRKRLLSNISSNVSLLLVRVVITFIMTPLYLRVLGKYDYGVWEMLAALVGYMGILDIGIKPTVGRYISKYHARHDSMEVRQVFSTACLFMFCMGLSGALLLAAGGYYWFGNVASEHYEPRYMLLLGLVAIQMVAQFPGLVIDGAFEGFQNYGLKNLLSIGMAISSALILYNFLDDYDGLILLGIVAAAGMVIKYFIGAGLLRMQRFGGLRFSLHDCSYSVFMRSLNFGLKSFIQGVASRIHLGSDRIIIGYFIGPAMVPLYAIPANLISYIRNFGWTITDVFMPLFSSLEANGEHEKINHVYLDGSRFCVGLLLPVCIGAVLVGGPFIGVWLGSDFKDDAEIIILLLVIFTLLPFLNPFSTRYLTALGKHGLLAKLYPAAALMNIVLSLLLVRRFGVAGVALGTMLPMLLIMPITLIRCCRHLGVSVSEYIGRSIRPSILPSIILVAVVSTYRYYTELSSYSELLVAIVLGAASYTTVFYFTGLKAHERRWLTARLDSVLGSRPVS